MAYSYRAIFFLFVIGLVSCNRTHYNRNGDVFANFEVNDSIVLKMALPATGDFIYYDELTETIDNGDVNLLKNMLVEDKIGFVDSGLMIRVTKVEGKVIELRVLRTNWTGPKLYTRKDYLFKVQTSM